MGGIDHEINGLQMGNVSGPDMEARPKNGKGDISDSQPVCRTKFRAKVEGETIYEDTIDVEAGTSTQDITADTTGETENSQAA